MSPFERLKKANTVDNLWIYILILLKNGPMHAFLIQEEIEKRFHFKTGKITPYRVLYRLETDGYVKSQQEDNRSVYQITKKGKDELEKAKNLYQEIIKFF